MKKGKFILINQELTGQQYILITTTMNNGFINPACKATLRIIKLND